MQQCSLLVYRVGWENKWGRLEARHTPVPSCNRCRAIVCLSFAMNFKAVIPAVPLSWHDGIHIFFLKNVWHVTQWGRKSLFFLFFSLQHCCCSFCLPPFLPCVTLSYALPVWHITWGNWQMWKHGEEPVGLMLPSGRRDCAFVLKAFLCTCSSSLLTCPSLLLFLLMTASTTNGLPGPFHGIWLNEQLLLHMLHF